MSLNWLRLMAIAALMTWPLAPAPGHAAPPSPLARPAWLHLAKSPWHYAALGYNGLPTAFAQGGVAWLGGNCRGPDGAEPLVTSSAGGKGIVAMDNDEAHVVWLESDGAIPATVYLKRGQCYGKPETLASLPALVKAGEFWQPLAQVKALPNHRLCYELGKDATVYCAEPNPDGTAKLTTLWTKESLRTALLPEAKPYASLSKIPATAVEGGWSYGKLLPTPNGSVFAAINVHLSDPPSQKQYTVGWIIERQASGNVVARMGPAISIVTPNIIEDGDWPPISAQLNLAYHSQTASVVVSPVANKIFGAAPGGYGAALLPLQDPKGLGLIDLTQLVTAYGLGVPPTLAQGPDGRVFLPFKYSNEHVKVTELLADPGLRDLDRDGVAESAEATAGTSDFRYDSDGGGTPDGVELHVQLTNPAAAGDDWAKAYPLDANYGYSALIHLRVPLKTLAFQWQTAPYLCGSGKCYDAYGKLVADVTATWTEPKQAVPMDTPALSGDGQTLVWSDGQNLRRRSLGSKASDEILISLPALTTLIGQELPAVHQFIVGPKGRVYVPGVDSVAVLGDGPPRLLWGSKIADCQALMGICAPADDPPVTKQLAHEGVAAFELVGYDAETDRLLAKVRTTLDVNLLAFGVDMAPQVVARGIDWPRVLIENPVNKDFDYFRTVTPTVLLPRGDHAWLWQWDLAYPNFADGGYRTFGGIEFGSWPGSFSAGWGDSLMVRSNEPGDLAGVIEVPQMKYDIRPGDAWVYSNVPGQKRGLAHTGPRGGVAQMSVEDLDPPAAMGASGDGQLCVVDAKGGLTLGHSPDVSGYPQKWLSIGNAHDAVDCLFDTDNHLFYLADHPPRIGTVDGDIVSERTLDAISGPLRLVRGTKKGEFRIVDSLEPKLACYNFETDKTQRGKFNAAGATTTRGGWLVALTAPDARLVQVADARACDDAPLEMGKPWADTPVPFDLITANLAERPDGLLILQRSTWKYLGPGGEIVPVLEAYDPRTNKSAPLVTQRIGPAFAQVPGGSWCDAWEPLVAHDPSRCWTMPPPTDLPPTDPPPGPTPTQPTANPPSADSDGGCAARPGPNHGILTLLGILAVLAVLARRRPAHVFEIPCR
jgi:hypothetical protein